MSGLGGMADHLFGAVVLGGEDDVAGLLVLAAGGAVIVDLVDGDALAVHVLGALLLGFGLAVGHQFDEVRRAAPGAGRRRRRSKSRMLK